MKNKTLGLWLMSTLFASIIGYILNVDSGLLGLIVIANWVFVIVAGTRLVNLKD